MRLRSSSGLWGVLAAALFLCGSARVHAQPAGAQPATPPPNVGQSGQSAPPAAANPFAGTAAAPQAATPPVAQPAAPSRAGASTATPSSAAALPAEAPAGADPGAAAAPGATSDAAGYTVRLRHLERSVSELKEQVFRTKARLQLLKETVLGGVIGASRAVIRHKNEMGGTFRLVKVVYALDGVQIFSKADDSGRLSEMKEFDIYNGAIQPGSHTISVQLKYLGHGFGVFSYLKGYNFNVRSSHTFVAAEGRATSVTVVGFEKGGALTNMEDKPALDFRVTTMAGENTPAAEGKK
jgi:hypothetical protein